LAWVFAIAFCAQRQLGTARGWHGFVSGFRHSSSIQAGVQATIVAFHRTFN
jgi:hypothetical protein